MANLTRDNHFVPQALLRQWSKDGININAYQIVVPNVSVPVWKLRSIRRTAFHRDLYTTFSNEKELDDFEHWIAKEFEEPGLEAVNKLLSHCRLKPDDWRSLARFFASQDLRTPLSYLEQMQMGGLKIPEIMESSMKLGGQFDFFMI